MYGLIGNPLGHSFSADFFNKKFADEGIDEVYKLFPLKDISELKDLLLTHPGLKGLNVTIPYKQQVIRYLTDIDDDARRIGAVNVIKISDGDKTLKGYNTDAIGFHDTIAPLIKPHMHGALVLGTGGASKAVIHVLKKMGFEVLSVSRHKSDATITYDEITPELLERFHVIVNTTPLGMWPDIEKAPGIPYEALSPLHLCYDLVYNPEVTEFMRRCAAEGATVKNGLDMLHGQALAAWRIWNS
jgi:shikimate dehydrogenase